MCPVRFDNNACKWRAGPQAPRLAAISQERSAAGWWCRRLITSSPKPRSARWPDGADGKDSRGEASDGCRQWGRVESKAWAATNRVLAELASALIVMKMGGEQDEKVGGSDQSPGTPPCWASCSACSSRQPLETPLILILLNSDPLIRVVHLSCFLILAIPSKTNSISQRAFL